MAVKQFLNTLIPVQNKATSSVKELAHDRISADVNKYESSKSYWPVLISY